MTTDRDILSEFEGRFPFLYQDRDGPAAPDPARQMSRTVETICSFSNTLALAALSRDCVVDEDLASVFRGYLARPNLRNTLYLQERLIQERTVGVEPVFGFAPDSASREQVFLGEYTKTLSDLRRAVESGNRRHAASFEEGARSYLALLRTYFKGDLVYRRGDKEEGRRHLKGYFGRGPEAASEPEGLCLRTVSDTLFPLYPFVRLDPAADLTYFVGCHPSEGLTFNTGRPGNQVTCSERDVLGSFSEFFLKAGAHQQARLLLRALDDGGKTDRNRRNFVYASHCCNATEHLRKGEETLALAEFEKAFKLRQDVPLLYFNLAQVHAKVRDHDRAIEVVRRLLVVHPKSDKAYEMMGDLYQAQGDRGVALKMYEKASSLNATNRLADKKRSRLISEIKKGVEKGQETAAKEAEAKKSPSKIEEFLTDMTLDAELGLYNPIVGRERERDQMIQILSCREKNNVLIVGDTGVGKTALVEDFVIRLVRGQVPGIFQGKKVHMMSVATLLAGAKFRGQFEERLLELIKEIKAADCLLVIDNIHNIISSGLTRGGTLDAANILKPSLIRGEVQAIGTTTYDEYRNHIEKDASLARAFQVVTLDEPTVEETLEIVRMCKNRYERYHGVELPDHTITATLATVRNCLKEGAFPDKALEVYDRACAAVSLRHAEGGSRVVAPEQVLEVVSAVSRIPVERLSEDRRSSLARMESHLEERVVGQDHALDAVARVLRASELNMTLNPRRPKGVFLFVGPTGVGKTELARALAEFLFGDEEKMIRIDMSEYMERISSSRLIGTAPGYVGYNDQNQLTDEVRKNPYSLVLLDEIEKADSQMINLFLQVFDAGRLTDGKGRTVHFDNTTIVMTSNLGTHLYSRPQMGYGRGPRRSDVSRSEMMSEIKRYFSPEFINRLDEIVFFRPLEHDAIVEIARMQFRSFEDHLHREGKELVITEAALEVLVEEGYSFEHGARNLSRAIRRRVLEPMGLQALDPTWEAATCVVVDAEDGRILLRLERPATEGGDASMEADRGVPLEGEASSPLEEEETDA